MSRFWNILYLSCHVFDTFHLLNVTFWLNILSVTFLNHFIFLMSRFWHISFFECHVSERFHILNVMFLKHFIFWTFLTHFMFWISHFGNISSFKLHFSETLSGHSTPFCCSRSHFDSGGKEWRRTKLFFLFYP